MTCENVVKKETNYQCHRSALLTPFENLSTQNVAFQTTCIIFAHYFHISIDLLTYLFTTKGKASIDRKVSISNEGLRPDIGDRHAHRQAIRAD